MLVITDGDFCFQCPCLSPPSAEIPDLPGTASVARAVSRKERAGLERGPRRAQPLSAVPRRPASQESLGEAPLWPRHLYPCDSVLRGTQTGGSSHGWMWSVLKKQPNHKQVAPPPPGQHHTVAGGGQPCAKPFPQSIRGNCALAGTHLQSERQPKGIDFGKNVLKY